MTDTHATATARHTSTVRLVVRLQRRLRHRRRVRVLLQLAHNYREDDLISLERLSDLPLDRIALLTCPTTSRMFACDAVAWATYFLSDTRHPCSRAGMGAEDVWSCYLQAFPLLSQEQKDQYRTCDLQAVRTPTSNTSATVKIKPKSPLFAVQIYTLASEPVSDNGESLNWTFEYALKDSRNTQMVSRRLRVNMVLLSSDIVSVF